MTFTIIIRSIIIYTIVLLLIRLMGKRQIGEMQPFELVITLVIADLATIPMAETSLPLIHGIIPLFALVCLHYLISLLTRKSLFFRKLINGRPVILISPEGVDFKALQKLGMNFNDLQEALRSNNFFNLEEVLYAILQTNGTLTVLPRAPYAPLNALDTTLCMGASISGLHGFNAARGATAEAKSVAVIGDSTFMHSGMTSLVNVAYNATNSTVIILDNSITGMTGHQQNPTTGYNIKGEVAAKVNLEALCKDLGINRVRVVDPYNLKECETVLKEELAVEEPSVIISRRPCVLLKSVKTLPSLNVQADKCKSCKRCMTLGCPAISMKDGKAVIDNTLCVGCGVCKQLCAFDAIN